MKPAERLHLIGSIPLDSSEQVFRRLSEELGPYLSRMPDGETGERSRWVYFQGQMLRAHPDMEIDPTVPAYPFATSARDVCHARIPEQQRPAGMIRRSP